MPFFTGYKKYNNGPNFNIGQFFNRHKGFDRVATEEDDPELDRLNSDSDHEEYNNVANRA